MQRQETAVSVTRGEIDLDLDYVRAAHLVPADNGFDRESLATEQLEPGWNGASTEQSSAAVFITFSKFDRTLKSGSLRDRRKTSSS